MDSLNRKWILMCKILKTLSHTERLKLLALLGSEDSSINQLALKCNISQTAVSRHLRVLQSSGLVDRRKQGLQVYYKIDSCISRLVQELEKMTLCKLNKQFRSE